MLFIKLYLHLWFCPLQVLTFLFLKKILQVFGLMPYPSAWSEKWSNSHQNHQYWWSFKTVWLTRVYGMNKRQLHMQNFDIESIIINLLSVFTLCSVNLHCKDSCKANTPWKVYFGRSFVYYENVQITQQITSIWQAINRVIHVGWTEEILTMCDDITQTFT